MSEDNLSIFLLITTTLVLVQIGFRDFFIQRLHISPAQYAQFLFGLIALQLIVIIGVNIFSISSESP